MCAVSPSPSHSTDADFARAITRKFAHGRFLVVGANCREVERQFAEAKREAVVMWSPGDLTTKLGQGETPVRFQGAVWFYPSVNDDDDRMVQALSHCAANIVLTPGPGADAATRRPQLVQYFARFGFSPDYECDLIELDPGVVCLRRQAGETDATVVPAVETALAKLNRALSALEYSVHIRSSELQGAHDHIAALEEKLLKLKEYRRESKLLKAQKQILRKSLERRVGQILLAPYRLPEKLLKTVWKTLFPQRKMRRSLPATEYKKWFERHRVTDSGLAQMRNESRAFASKPLISVITPVFDTPVQRLEE